MPKRKAYLLTDGEAAAALLAMRLSPSDGLPRARLDLEDAAQAQLAHGVDLATLVRHLDRQIHHAVELGCTCVHRRQGHEPNCTGVGITKDARAYLARLRKRGIA